jgi:transaldolase/glucose-6-phosphate isomerase
VNSQLARLPSGLQAEVDEALERAGRERWAERLWAKDASLWTGQDEARWLKWLDAGEGSGIDVLALKAFQSEVQAAGFAHALLLGMGGSSLGPEVLAQTFGAQPGFPQLLVLDSTDPAQVRRLQGLIDPKSTLFIVSSKSGSTLEPDILQRHFYEVAKQALGDAAASRFVAVTDPGSKLEQLAKAEGFRRIFPGEPQIGGRYSVLSNFGLVPAAVMGLDLDRFLASTRRMVDACKGAEANPGLELGCILGTAARGGRDKLSILASRGLADLGAWLEQLVAESTGKHGKAVIPVDAEPVGAIDAYSHDRVFAYLRLEGQDEPGLDALADGLSEAGHPLVWIDLPSRDDLGQEFFRWEIATAIAGAVMQLHPFDQPDVEASKIKTRALTDQYEETGALEPEAPAARDGAISLYADPRNAEALGTGPLQVMLEAHFRRIGEGDYVGLLAYIDRSHAHVQALQAIRRRIRDRKRVATVLGFGPRFLHSTGQAYKGGPNSGVFLQITWDPGEDVPVPGRKYGFKVVEAAQARGDMGVLVERGRRVIRLDLGRDVEAGLKWLAEAVDRALG